MILTAKIHLINGPIKAADRLINGDIITRHNVVGEVNANTKLSEEHAGVVEVHVTVHETYKDNGLTSTREVIYKVPCDAEFGTLVAVFA